jgi:hypothetical protein
MSIQGKFGEGGLTVIPEHAWFDCGLLEEGCCYHGVSLEKGVKRYAYAHASGSPIRVIAACRYNTIETRPCPYLVVSAQSVRAEAHVKCLIGILDRIGSEGIFDAVQID